MKEIFFNLSLLYLNHSSFWKKTYFRFFTVFNCDDDNVHVYVLLFAHVIVALVAHVCKSNSSVDVTSQVLYHTASFDIQLSDPSYRYNPAQLYVET